MDIEQLLAEREIYRQLVRLARAMDDRAWEVIGGIVSDDIRAELGTGQIVGGQSFIELIRSYIDNCGTTQHILGNIIIDVTGDTATSDSYVADIHLSKDETKDLYFRTLGNYSDIWVKRDGVWLLSERVKKTVQ